MRKKVTIKYECTDFCLNNWKDEQPFVDTQNPVQGKGLERALLNQLPQSSAQGLNQ